VLPEFLKDVLVEIIPTNEVFWCSHCDSEQINSQDPSSGKFFRVNGHVYNWKEKKAENDWPTVVIAICSECLKKSH